ncbi:15295_t:CDS:2, partial [Acaulospora colombiana]
TEDLDEDLDDLSLIRQAGEIQRKLESIVSTNEDLSKNAHLFTNSYAFAHQNPTSAPQYTSLSPHDLDVLLSEMEPDIRSASTTLQTISQLDQRGVTGAGKLENYEPLLGRMSELIKKSREDVGRLEGLEARVWKLLEGYSGRVDLMSRLFVQWSDLVGEVDGRVTKLEKQKEERANMGL